MITKAKGLKQIQDHLWAMQTISMNCWNFFFVETSNYNYLCTSLDIKNYITSYHLVNFIEMSVLWAPFIKLCTWAFFVGEGKIFM